MKEELIKLASEKGFSQHVDYYNYYHWLCDLQKWLREVNDFHVKILYGQKGNFAFRWYFNITTIAPFPTHMDYSIDSDTYEQALEKGLKKAMELIPETKGQS